MTKQSGTMLRCISPIDGSVFAERSALSAEEARGVIADARAAQKDWAKVPLEDRIKLVLAGIDQLAAVNEDVTVELAHMRGRPVRHGGEFGPIRERADYMAGIAPEAFGAVGAALNFASAIIVSKLTAEPPERIQHLVEDIRVPKGAGDAAHAH